MKLPFTLLNLLVLSLAFAPTTLSQKSCSFSTADGKGKADVRCSQHGCTAICGSSNACYAACGNDLVVTRFTLKLVGKSGTEVAGALSQKTRRKIVFKPWEKYRKMPINVDVQDDNMWNTMDYLYERGDLTVDGVDWRVYRDIRRAAQENQKLSVEFNDISMKDALAHLSFLTGATFGVEPGGAEKVVTVSFKDITVSEIISRMSEQSGVKIELLTKRVSL